MAGIFDGIEHKVITAEEATEATEGVRDELLVKIKNKIMGEIHEAIDNGETVACFGIPHLEVNELYEAVNKWLTKLGYSMTDDSAVFWGKEIEPKGRVELKNVS